jgi:hypothetical protein
LVACWIQSHKGAQGLAPVAEGRAHRLGLGRANERVVGRTVAETMHTLNISLGDGDQDARIACNQGNGRQNGDGYQATAAHALEILTRPTI